MIYALVKLAASRTTPATGNRACSSSALDRKASSSCTLFPASRLAHLAWLTPALLVGALALTVPASAQVTQYSSQASFDAATSSLTTFNFNGDAPANGQKYYPGGLTMQGVTFTGIGTSVFVVDPGLGRGNPFGGSQYLDIDTEL